MITFINRLIKVLFGSVLIAATLWWGDTGNMERMAPLLLLAPAFVFSGLFNWQPLYALTQWLVGLFKPGKPMFGNGELKSPTA